MAGAGHKTWATNEEPSSADFQAYLQDQVVMVFASAAARTTALPSPDEGMVSYLLDANTMSVYLGSQWQGIPILSSDTGLSITADLAGILRVVRDNSDAVGGYVAYYSEGTTANRMGYVGYPGSDDFYVVNEEANGQLVVDLANSGTGAIRLRKNSNDRIIIGQDDITFRENDGSTNLLNLTESGLVAYQDINPSADNTYDLGNASLRWSVGRFFTLSAEVLTIGGTCRPDTDNTSDLGSATFRWDDVYATNGTIQTSDERFKVAVKTMEPADCLDVVRQLGGNVIEYRRPRDNERQREKARKTHWGFGYQRLVQTIGQDNGITVEADEPEHPHGVRYDEAVGPLTGAVLHVDDRLTAAEARIADLEAKIEALTKAAA